MNNISKSISLAGAVLIGVVGIGVTSSLASTDTTLPNGDFPQCSDAVTTYCISEVTFLEGGVRKPGKWFASGTPTNDSDGDPNTTGFSTFGSTATNYTGRWSYDGFPITRKHDGVYIRAYAPNASLGSDLLRIGVEPAGPASDPTGQVGRIKDSVTNNVGSLDKDMGIEIKVRLGGLVPALNLAAAENVVISRSADGATPVLTFQASPTMIPIVSSSNACKSADGKADANVNQLFLYMLWANGKTPFGSGGLSGDMTIASNGFCSLSTPVWNSTNQTFDFTASAPHYAANGTDVNTGFYKATIPAADAKLLFGLEPEEIQSGGVSTQALFSASSALEVEITETDGVQKSFTKNVGFDGKNFIVSAINFSYSTPKIRLKKGALTPVTSSAPAAGSNPVSSSPSNVPAVSGPSSVAVKPSSPRLSALKQRRGIISVTFATKAGTSYSARARSGKKSVMLTCKKSKTKMTCTTRAKLTKGTWSVSVTPSMRGVKGSAASRSIRIR
jgi:hypothetical protein